ncbi:MAG: cysteine hydrolase family protein [Candidatus Paceibacterota bacterium]
MNIKIPKSNKKKALILVDIQNGFIKRWDKSFLKNIKNLISKQKYDLYVEVTFHAEKGSLWDKQTNWTFPYEPTVPEVLDLLKGKNVIKIIKETRSAFKGNVNLFSVLQKNKIEEVHVVGFDTNDCVFATAQEAFDLGFYTYVIEECTGASQGEKIHKNAIAILRCLGLTNHA